MYIYIHTHTHKHMCACMHYMRAKARRVERERDGVVVGWGEERERKEKEEIAGTNINKYMPVTPFPPVYLFRLSHLFHLSWWVFTSSSASCRCGGGGVKCGSRGPSPFRPSRPLPLHCALYFSPLALFLFSYFTSSLFLISRLSFPPVACVVVVRVVILWGCVKKAKVTLKWEA